MPMPTPETGEPQNQFIDRCMADPAMTDEFPDAAQRRAVCQSQWNQEKTARPKGPSKWLRLGPSRGLAAGEDPAQEAIDREHGMIRGASVATKGEAAGHDVWLDDETLDLLVALGNAAKVGIKSRFTHPNESGDGLGHYLGRLRNFRRDGDQVRADLHFGAAAYKSPEGNLAEYVMDLAEEDPDAFGMSIVVPRDYFYHEEEDRLYMRPTKLYAADVVDDPAANEGLFSTRPTLAQQATQFLDSHFGADSLEVVRDRITDFLDAYFKTRFGAGVPSTHESGRPPDVSINNNEGAPEMSETDTKKPAQISMTQAELDTQLAAARKAGADEAQARGDAALAEQLSQCRATAATIVGMYAHAKLGLPAQQKTPLAELVKLPTIEAARAVLYDAMCADRPPVGDAGSDPLEKPDPAAKYRAEYRKAGGQAKLGITEEQYVQTALRDESGGVVG